MIYRGYDLTEIAPGKWSIKKDGVNVGVGFGSDKAALKWVDDKKKIERKAETGH